VRDNGAWEQVPFHADNDAGACTLAAIDLMANLKAAGFACDGPLVEAAALRAKVAAETGHAPTVDGPAPDAAASRTAAAGPAAPDGTTSAPDGTTPASDTGGVPAETTSAPAGLPDADKIAGRGAIAPQPARNGPVDLTAELAPASVDAPAGGPRAAAGRFVGGAASDDNAAARYAAAEAAATKKTEPTPVMTPAAVDDADDDTPAPEAETAATQRAPTETAAVDPAAPATAASRNEAPTALDPRTPEEVVERVLRAQAFAWNDGDLEAFMDGYWRSEKTRFVSGANVIRGWDAVMKRYRRRYGAGAEMGRLAFDEIDVDMVDEDHAIAVGRFRLARADGNSSGAFSLVLKKIDGAWRIIHDHTSADDPSSANAAN